MDLKKEAKWVHDKLLESKDPRFVEAVKNMIESMQKVKKDQCDEQERQDKLMAEAEADITAERVYSVEEAHKIVNGWQL